jgi:hypothetical protein
MKKVYAGVRAASGAAALVAALIVPAARIQADEQAVPGQPAAQSDALRFEIGPVAGLTTAWHPAPVATAVPLGSVVTMRVGAAPAAAVAWRGAIEIGRDPNWSTAVCPLIEPGEALIEVDVTVAGEMHTLRSLLDVIDIAPQEIKLTTIQVEPTTLVIDEELSGDALNEATMAAYFGEESIAAVRHAGGHRWRTSVGRTVRMSLGVSPAGFAPLIEWRTPAAGVPARLGPAFSLRFEAPGVYGVAAGPPVDEARARFGIYDVVITSHQPGDIVPEDEPVTFEAATIPPGLEHLVTWVSSTKYGSAWPVRGEGRTFTVTFHDTYGPLPDGSGDFQWLGVRADSARFGQDQKGFCMSGTHRRMNEAVGRALPDIFPNGALELIDVPISLTGSNSPCVPPVTLGGGITNERYTVMGNNLQQVSNNMLDTQNGVGPLIQGRRYAGSAQLSYSYQTSDPVVVDGNLSFQITDISWTTVVRLPNWTPPPGTPANQVAEWNRFRMALNTHEKGHAGINDTHMMMIETRMENQPAGKVVVTGTNLPQFNEEGDPATPADAARAMQIDTAISNAINNHPQMATLDTAQDNYDAPNSPTNPTGTNHGATQGATLNTNP